MEVWRALAGRGTVGETARRQGGDGSPRERRRLHCRSWPSWPSARSSSTAAGTICLIHTCWAHCCAQVFVGQDAIMATPAMSALIRRRHIYGERAQQALDERQREAPGAAQRSQPAGAEQGSFQRGLPEAQHMPWRPDATSPQDRLGCHRAAHALPCCSQLILPAKYRAPPALLPCRRPDHERLPQPRRPGGGLGHQGGVPWPGLRHGATLLVAAGPLGSLKLR